MSISDKYRTLLRTQAVSLCLYRNEPVLVHVCTYDLFQGSEFHWQVRLSVGSHETTPGMSDGSASPAAVQHSFVTAEWSRVIPTCFYIHTHTYLADAYQNIPGWIYINRLQLLNDGTNEWNKFLSGFQFKICAIICEYKYVFNRNNNCEFILISLSTITLYVYSNCLE